MVLSRVSVLSGSMLAVEERLTVNVEAPPPRNILGECASDDRPKCTGEAPDTPNETEILATFPVTDEQQDHIFPGRQSIPLAEQVGNADVGEDDQPAPAHALQSPAGEQHANVNAQRCDQGADEEDDVRHEQDELATPYIAELAPGGHGGGSRQEVAGADPGILALRDVEHVSDGRDGGGYNGLPMRSATHELQPRECTRSGREGGRTYRIERGEKDGNLLRITSALCFPPQAVRDHARV